MVKLQDIICKDGVISCDYFPELTDKGGHIEINCATGEMIRYTFSDHPDGKKLYLAAAVKKLIGSIGKEDIPSSAWSVFM